MSDLVGDACGDTLTCKVSHFRQCATHFAMVNMTRAEIQEWLEEVRQDAYERGYNDGYREGVLDIEEMYARREQEQVREQEEIKDNE